MCSSCNKGKRTAPRQFNIPLGASKNLASSQTLGAAPSQTPAPKPVQRPRRSNLVGK